MKWLLVIFPRAANKKRKEFILENNKIFFCLFKIQFYLPWTYLPQYNIDYKKDWFKKKTCCSVV